MAFTMKTAAARERAAASPPARTGIEQVAAVRKKVATYQRAEDYAEEIRKLYNEAAETFLLIGRYLIRAKASLPYGEYQRMIEESLPFSASRARQLRMVAEMVDAGRVPEDVLPRSSGAAYEICKLPPLVLERAKEEGVVRPDVQRPEVIAWRERVLGQDGTEEPQEQIRKLALLRSKIEKWEKALAAAREEVAKIERRGTVTIDGETIREQAAE